MSGTKLPSGGLRTLVVVALIGIAAYQVVSGVLLKKIGVPGLFTLEFDTAAHRAKATSVSDDKVTAVAGASTPEPPLQGGDVARSTGSLPQVSTPTGVESRDTT